MGASICKRPREMTVGTPQELNAEADVLARTVSRLSDELTAKTLECERYRRALEEVIRQCDCELVVPDENRQYDISTARETAYQALNP